MLVIPGGTEGCMASGTGVSLERIPYDAVAWATTVDEHPDLEVYHGPAWLTYLATTQGIEPVVAVVSRDGRPIGHFVGGIVHRYGIRILGSPLRGWGTQAMGFLLDPGEDRLAAAGALLPFAFRELGCLHVELADRQLAVDGTAALGYRRELGMTFRVDLTGSEEEILGRMESNTRRLIRRAGRTGLRVEAVTGVEFADEFHRHLTRVFALQGLAPTYGVERVRSLITLLGPTGQLHMVRVASADGTPLAAGISVGRGRNAIVWGIGFDREHTSAHPNQALWWEMMRAWRERGALAFDMGGGGEYKAKYGGERVATVHLFRSRHAVMGYGRTAVRRLFRARQALAGRRAGSAATPRSTDR
jgi:CelD/BcsL family acetyltransferase involved in cellulose biosynthesis